MINTCISPTQIKHAAEVSHSGCEAFVLEVSSHAIQLNKVGSAIVSLLSMVAMLFISLSSL